MEKKSGWFWLIVGSAVFAVLLLMATYHDNNSLKVVNAPNVKLEVQQMNVSTSTVKEKVAIISIVGVISEANGMVESTTAKLQAAVVNPDIKAIILWVESPGGSVNASDLIWNEVIKAKKSKKPIVAFYNGISASGGYYVSVPADKIIATPATWTGSIGVIMQVPNYYGLMSMLGLKMVTIKSGKSKDMLSPYKPANKGDEAILQALVDESYGQFVQIVSKGRKMNPNKVRELADGRIYSAKQAKENGLIDEVGYFEDAVKMAQKLSGYKDASPVEILEKRGFMGVFSQKITHIEKLFSNLFPKSGLYYLDNTLLMMYQER